MELVGRFLERAGSVEIWESVIITSYCINDISVHCIDQYYCLLLATKIF